jgi:hypothetical protein
MEPCESLAVADLKHDNEVLGQRGRRWFTVGVNEILVSLWPSASMARSHLLLHRPPLSNDAIGIGTVTGLARRPQPVRTRKFDYITLSLGKLVREPTEKTLGRFGLASEPHGLLTGFRRTANHADTHGNDKNKTQLHSNSAAAKRVIGGPK